MNSDKIGHIWVHVLIYYIRMYIGNFKNLKLQLSLNWDFRLLLDFSVSVLSPYEYFNLNISFFDLIKFQYYINKECNHAGHHLFFNVIGLQFNFDIEDYREYDYDNECFIDS